MADKTKVSGKTENNMGSENVLIHKVRLRMGDGTVENELNGYNECTI